MTTTADSLDDDGEDYLLDNIKEDDDLKQFYDMQTWEMYLRITEARRKRSPPLESIAQAASITGTAFSAVPDFPRQQQQELQQGCYFVPSSYNYPHQGHHFVDDDDDDDASSVHSSDHEMVFGDLED